jgi:S1-C subfamily serine protease
MALSASARRPMAPGATALRPMALSARSGAKMKLAVSVLVSLLTISTTVAWTQDFDRGFPPTIENGGSRFNETPVESTAVVGFQQIDDLPTGELSKIASTPISELTGGTRSAKDAQIYRVVSPSVVLILTKDGLGSGTLIGSSGEVITNWHVVNGPSSVGVVYKPGVEGREPTREDIKMDQVVRYDEVADLALVKVTEVPQGRSPVRLADGSDISIGFDVHAIGHPTGEAWTYTKGVISQYRLGYEWEVKEEKIKHHADVVQTQTPINPGNSGGPLISDSGTLIGVNSFKASGEGLNFAVSVDEVKKFLTRSGNRIASPNSGAPSKAACEPKQISKFRNKNNDAIVISYDMFCNGKVSGNYIIPDKPSEAILLTVDRNGDNKTDILFFDFKRQEKWDLSFWDEHFDGHWTLVGYHDDGSLKPSRFESYETYRRRTASR